MEECPHWHLTVFSSGLGLGFSKVVPFRTVRTWRRSHGVSSLLSELLVKKVLAPYLLSPKFVFPVFAVSEPSGGLRLILDLSFLNRFLKPVSFHLHWVEQLTVALLRPSWFAKIDLRDKYWHVPIAPNFLPYLEFAWRDRFSISELDVSTAPAAVTGLVNFLCFVLPSTSYASST